MLIRQPSAVVTSISSPCDESTAGLSIAQMVAHYARVSNPGNQANTESMPKLLAYLVRNKHWSPFQMVSVTVKVETSRAIAHQMIRHASIGFQEFSQRYAAVENLQPFFSKARMSGSTNRQGSVAATNVELAEWWMAEQDFIWHSATTRYSEALKMGIAPEVARNLLPEGMTPTTLYAAAPLRSWIHYLEQRLDAHAQLEHRQLASAIRTALIAASPDLVDVLPGVAS